MNFSETNPLKILLRRLELSMVLHEGLPSKKQSDKLPFRLLFYCEKEFKRKEDVIEKSMTTMYEEKVSKGVCFMLHYGNYVKCLWARNA